MGIPLEVATEGVENHDIARSEVHGFVNAEEHTGKDIGHGMKKTVQQGTVFEKKGTEIFIDGEDAVPCLWVTLTSLKDIEVVRSMEYLLPQVGQNRL